MLRFSLPTFKPVFTKQVVATCVNTDFWSFRNLQQPFGLLQDNWGVWCVSGQTRNIAIQLVLQQQCGKKSHTFSLPVSLYLNLNTCRINFRVSKKSYRVDCELWFVPILINLGHDLANLFMFSVSPRVKLPILVGQKPGREIHYCNVSIQRNVLAIVYRAFIVTA